MNPRKGRCRSKTLDTTGYSNYVLLKAGLFLLMWKFLFPQKQKIKLTEVQQFCYKKIEITSNTTVHNKLWKNSTLSLKVSLYIYVYQINILHSEYKVCQNPSAKP